MSCVHSCGPTAWRCPDARATRTFDPDLHEPTPFSRFLDCRHEASNRVAVLSQRPPLRPFALAGMLLPIWLLGGSFVVGLTRPGYEPLRDAISELGERGAPTALAWNLGGFGVVAVLYAAYAVAIRAGFGPGWLFRLTVLQAVLIAAGGVLACDPGCPPVPATPMMFGHMVVGLAYFAITTLLPLVAWRAFQHRPAWRSWARPSLAVGVILVVLFFIGPALGADRVGAWQRVDLLIALSWQASVALQLHREVTRARAATPGHALPFATDL